MQQRLTLSVQADEYLPVIDDLPEFLKKEKFEERFGGPGSWAFRAVIRDIDQRLDQCPSLS